jgi:1-acyl-sn-glycerol-3-phosphate acyltransferase
MITKNTARFINMLPKPVLKFTAKVLLSRYISKYANINVVGLNKLERIKDPVIFISNHLSNSDGLVLNKVLKERDVTFIAGIKLSQNALTNLGLEVVRIIPINPSAPDRAALSKAVKLLKSGRSVCIFPEGTRSRKSSLLKGKKGLLLIWKLAGGVPIVPIGIEGTEKLMPINEEDMGKEKFFHADVKVTIGESFMIPGREEDEDKSHFEERIMTFTMKKIAALLSSKYQGIYKDNQILK